MPLSERTRKSMTEGSWIRRMFEEGNILKKRFGQDKIFDLTLGNPITEPPEEFNRELKKLAENPLPGMHRYMENAGYEDTRAAVALQLKIESGINFSSKDIVMTCGAAAALNIILKTILNRGDEIILFSPYFVEYRHYIENHDGIVKVVPSGENFIPRLDVLEKTITPRTKGVIMNSPNNPTGVVYSEDFLSKLGKLLAEKETELRTDIYLISDEPYRRIIFDGLKYPFIWPHHKQSIVGTSHSKDLALAGERIGYVAIHPECRQNKELIDGFIFCNRVLGYVNAPALMQHVVKKLQDVTVSIADYEKKRDYLYSNLVEMGYTLVKPQGAFYMFPKAPNPDEIAFVNELRENYGVLVVPGSGFGLPGYFRIAYCTNDRTIEGSLDGLRKAINKYRG